MLLTEMELPADQGKNGDAESQNPDQDGWNPWYECRESIQQEEQDQTPGGDRIGHIHCHSPLGKSMQASTSLLLK
jgi:hypothetical protein